MYLPLEFAVSSAETACRNQESRTARKNCIINGWSNMYELRCQSYHICRHEILPYKDCLDLFRNTVWQMVHTYRQMTGPGKLSRDYLPKRTPLQPNRSGKHDIHLGMRAAGVPSLLPEVPSELPIKQSKQFDRTSLFSSKGSSE
jgi:hypothetical protein